MLSPASSARDTDGEVAFVAWALKARDKAFVPTPEFLPAAESMERNGWLSSTTLENGDVAYAFTPTGETALDMSSWSASAAAR